MATLLTFIGEFMEWSLVGFLVLGLLLGGGAQYLIGRASVAAKLLAMQVEGQQLQAVIKADQAALTAKLEGLTKELTVAQAGQLKTEQALAEQRQLLSASTADKAALTMQLQEMSKVQQQDQSLLQQREKQLLELQQQLSELSSQKAALDMALEKDRQQSDEKLQLLQQAREQLNKEFESLANRIFEDKSERFSKNSKQSLDSAINPLREQLKDFKAKVETVYEQEGKERASLLTELGHLKELNQQMSQDALNLTKALKGDNKAQGNWGEVILERVLEESGLHKGREYETQVSLKDDDGRRRNPDVIVHLPDNKDIIIDAKVSLLAYERYCSSEQEEDHKLALKQHIASVRDHIQNLSVKDYESLAGLRTLDFVFIFIPIEAAFMAAFEHDSAMFRDAYEKNIIVVSPTTLLASLRTVQSIWRYERQNKNAEEIARQAGALHDKFVGFIKDLDDVGKQLERASQSHHAAYNKLASGRGNLVSGTRRLEKLGAKVKKPIPDSLLSRVNDDDAVVAQLAQQNKVD